MVLEKLVLQGRPELLFLESIEIITQLFDTDEISTKLNESGFFEVQLMIQLFKMIF